MNVFNQIRFNNRSTNLNTVVSDVDGSRGVKTPIASRAVATATSREITTMANVASRQSHIPKIDSVCFLNTRIDYFLMDETSETININGTINVNVNASQEARR